MTTNRLDNEIQEILHHCDIRPEKEGIEAACFYHQTDQKLWLPLMKHLQAVSWQCEQDVRWASYEYKSKETKEIGAYSAVSLSAMTYARIILVGMSVDMQLVFQQEQLLYQTLLTRLQHTKLTEAYLAGVRLRRTVWDMNGLEYFPPSYNSPIAEHHHKDAAYVDIARRVRTWIRDVRL